MRAAPPDLYLSAPHACSYLPRREAVMLVTDPRQPADGGVYAGLARQGFRRSGRFTYRPHCRGCSACVSVRIPSDEFRPDRAQRRILKANQDVQLVPRPPLFDASHFRLYSRYQDQRHPGSSMQHADPERYLEFLVSPTVQTTFLELRLGTRLVGVAVTDTLVDGLSAVYTWYEPELRGRSLGTLAILRQIQWAQELGLRWMYLGYWISESPKMAYKTRFQPIEGYREGRWERLDRDGRRVPAAAEPL
jgi:leucyl-tRNA---protein transferase